MGEKQIKANIYRCNGVDGWQLAVENGRIGREEA